MCSYLIHLIFLFIPAECVVRSPQVYKSTSHGYSDQRERANGIDSLLCIPGFIWNWLVEANSFGMDFELIPLRWSEALKTWLTELLLPFLLSFPIGRWAWWDSWREAVSRSTIKDKQANLQCCESSNVITMRNTLSLWDLMISVVCWQIFAMICNS